jgi:hypothetical protein
MCTLQRPVLHLDVSTPQRPELHLDLSTTESLAASGRVYATEASAARGRVYTTMGGNCTWTCLHCKGLHVLLIEVSTLQRTEVL